MGLTDNRDIWSGLYDVGTGLFSSSLAQNEARKRLAAAQGPVYNAANSGATAAITAAGNMDPNAIAAQRFGQQQALVAPVQQKQIDDLMRSLYAKGMLGSAVYNPGVAGYTPDGKTAVNPQLAALFAGQNAANNQSAYDSMDKGQTYLNSLLERSGMLTNQARTAQGTGLTAQGTQPSSATAISQLLKGAGTVFKAPGVMSGITGLFGKGMDWLGQQTGWWGQPQMSGLDYDFAG